MGQFVLRKPTEIRGGILYLMSCVCSCDDCGSGCGCSESTQESATNATRSANNDSIGGYASKSDSSGYR